MLTLQIVASGVLLGGFYACFAIGFSVVWGVTGLVNLSHGALMVMGAYMTWWLNSRFGLDPFAALPFAALALFLFGIGLQRWVLERVIRTSLFMTLVLTFGLNMVLVNVLLELFNADARAISMPYSSLALEVAGLRLPWTRLAVFGLALFLTLLLHLFMGHTRTGNAIRATAQNPRAAATLGIDARNMRVIAFGIGAGLAGAAGSLMASLYAFSPGSGDSYTMKAFVIVLLGGLGNMGGAIAAAILLGVTENLMAGLGVPGLSNAVSFLLLLTILMIRPRGLFGARHLVDARAK